MHRVLIGLLSVAALGAGGLAAQEGKPPPGGQPSPLREEYQRLAKARDAKIEELEKAYTEAVAKENREHVAAIFRLAEKYPGEPLPFDALEWVVENVVEVKDRERALEQLVKHHAKHERAGKLCESLVGSTSPWAEKFLRAVLADHPDRANRGRAALALGNYFKSRAEEAQRPDHVEAAVAEAEKFYQLVLDKYGDVE
jgi:hypothetical protein